MKAGVKVEGEPAGELRVRRVLPQAEWSAERFENLNEVGQTRVAGRRLAARGQVEQESQVYSGVEGEPPAGGLQAQQPGYLPGRVHYGIALYSAGRKPDAIKAWEDVLSRSPGNKSAEMYLNLVKDAGKGDQVG